MKLTFALLLLAAAAPLAAQTPAPKPAAPKSAVPPGATIAAKPVAKPAVAASACVKLPDMSSKIPALPSTAPCAKHLYTITTVPAVKLENVSPMEGPTLREDLGIEATSFSLDYIDTKVGTGQLAGPHTFYTINYSGYLLDGTKFDSSVDRGEPITIAYGGHQVIPGWDTGFAGMRVGGQRRLIIPFQLAYGANGKPPIPPRSTLVFDVELMGISDTPPPAKPKPETPAAAPATPPASAPAATPPAAAPAPPPASPKP